jgi:Carboxypeptidase regulatory-like domain
MVKASVRALLLLLLTTGSARAQAPTGTLAGIVTDQTGAALASANVVILARESAQTRTLQTSTEGHDNAAALPPGSYHVTVEAAGFKQVVREAIVEVGTTTTLDLRLDLGQVAEQVTVDAVTPLIRRDHHQVGGLVTRDQIERLPLNGRTFLELAKLEPGVTNPARLADGRVFVSTLGGGVQTIPRIGTTNVTVDGAAIGTPGTVGVLLQVSQDLVQEFQISTVNFEQTSSLTSNGSINIVTRSGGNGYHGGGFYFNRDEALAAYPGLRREAANPHPSFERHQFGRVAWRPVAEGSGVLLRELRGDRANVGGFDSAARRVRRARRDFSQPLRRESVQRARRRAPES